MTLNRRDFRKLAGVTSVGGYFLSGNTQLFSTLSTVQADSTDFEPDIELLLRASRDTVHILDRQSTIKRECSLACEMT